MNNQEAFDTVWEWFITQKNYCSIRRIPNGYGSECVYFNQETKTKCAIGCLLPDEMAEDIETRFSGEPITNIINEDINIEVFFNEVSVDLLEDLQSAHDRSIIFNSISREMLDESFFMLLRNNLVIIARDYSLKVPS